MIHILENKYKYSLQKMLGNKCQKSKRRFFSYQDFGLFLHPIRGVAVLLVRTGVVVLHLLGLGHHGHNSDVDVCSHHEGDEEAGPGQHVEDHSRRDLA